eukprot:1148773-Pelagomonas_calceolata.AAC.7
MEKPRRQRESPSLEGKREATVGLVGIWQQAARGPRRNNCLSGASAFTCADSRKVWAVDSPTHTQEDCVESGLGTLKGIGNLRECGECYPYSERVQHAVIYDGLNCRSPCNGCYIANLDNTAPAVEALQ